MLREAFLKLIFLFTNIWWWWVYMHPNTCVEVREQREATCPLLLPGGFQGIELMSSGLVTNPLSHLVDLSVFSEFRLWSLTPWVCI